MAEKNILLLNGHEKFPPLAMGKFNKSMFDLAKQIIEKCDKFSLNTTIVEQHYETEKEIEKLLMADFIIYQYPIYWFNVPAALKKYMDQVYTHGYKKIYAGDSTSNKKYGQQGLLKGKYMLSVTFNASGSIFNPIDGFFANKNTDDVLNSMHKTQQYLGLKKMPSFACYDIVSGTKQKEYLDQYKDHLNHILTSEF